MRALLISIFCISLLWIRVVWIANKYHTGEVGLGVEDENRFEEV